MAVSTFDEDISQLGFHQNRVDGLLPPQAHRFLLPNLYFLLKIFGLMQITAMVGSHCDDTHTAFRTDPPLTQEILDCAVTHFFPAGLGDMLSTRDGLLLVARVGIPSGVVQDYERYLTSAEMKVRKQQATGGTKRQVSLQDRATESGVPLE